MKKPISVDAYIAAAPREVRGRLNQVRSAIRKAAPKAMERISYGMPFYEYGGSGYKGRLIYFAAFKEHIGVFIPPSQGAVPREMEMYRTAKSSFRFPLKEPIPLGVISRTVKQLVRQRVAANRMKS
ncbi:MAG: DUF1801 domain-containing protein [candidate division Zixibacteria bacterium]|nr:DUF1801 domain-containing protein [candidate division Zixibacteria bacterium]